VLFVLGLALLLAGVVLLFLGRVRPASDLVISSGGSRRAAIALLAFFPVAIGVRYVLDRFEWDAEPVITGAYWAVFGACVLAGLCLLAAGRENPAEPSAKHDSPPPSEKKPIDFP
jgi:hypothetical protein